MNFLRSMEENPKLNDGIRQFRMSPRGVRVRTWPWVLFLSGLLFVCSSTNVYAGEKKITVDCWAQFPDCPDIVSGHGDGRPVTAEIVAGSEGCTFMDPLDPGYTLTSVKILLYARLWGDFPTVQMYLNSEPIGGPLPIFTPIYECDGTPGAHSVFTFETPTDRPEGIPGYRYGQTNTLFLSMGGGSIVVEDVDVFLGFHSIDFDLSASSSASDRKVLISKHRGDDQFPSPYQQKLLSDRQIEITATVRDGKGNPGSGKTVYFRVVDPADTSGYVTPKTNNDNKDQDDADSGTLSETSATSDSTGKVTTVLTVTDQYAGDNYRIDASFTSLANPDTTCRPCYSTGVITAWKRIYLEVDQMFRRGAYVIGTHPAGSDRITVSNRDFAAGDIVRLIHGPRRDGAGTLAFYADDHQVVNVLRSPTGNAHRILVLNPPLRDEYTEDTSIPGLAYLNDAVGVVGAGFFSPNDSYVNAAFAPAFVEFTRVGQFVEELPFEPIIGDTENMNAFLAHIAAKWLENAFIAGMGRNILGNHEHVLGGTRIPDGGKGQQITITTGLTTVGGGSNWSWLFVDRIEAAVASSGLPWSGMSGTVVNGETTAHEIGHQWKMNVGLVGDHCRQYMYGRVGLFCTMNSADNAAQMGDGIVGFHHLGDTDSEFRVIREKDDPVPQN